VKRAEEVAGKHGVTALQIALAWVLAQPLEVFAMIGPQSIEETRTSLASLEVSLTPDELRYLNLED
jgi:aryl-alcohol dehydrogenase-like predicted oxidoreductase